MLGCGQGGSCCGQCAARRRSPGMGGIFSQVLNVAGSFVGDPALGSQIGAQAGPGYAPIGQTPQQIADTVSVQTLAALNKPVDVKSILPQAQQIASGVAPQLAQALAAKGYIFAPGTYGAELQKPSPFDAFGGQNKTLVELGFGALGVMLLLKLLKG